MNKTRGNLDLLVKQCKCGKSIEDDAHIINNCELNHNLIIKRHDHLVNKMAKELKREHSSATIWVERHWRINLQLVKPDITMIDRGHCYIIELMCPYETSMKYLDQQVQDKVEKYKPLLKDLKQVDCHSGDVISLVISSLGTIPESTNTQLCKLCQGNISKHYK